MLRNVPDQTITIKDRRIVVDVLRPNSDLSITGQRRLECIRLIVGENVEVPHRSASWLVAVKWPGQADLSRMLVDDKCSVVGKLPGQAVADVRIAIYVRISRSHLHADSLDVLPITGKT